jgi:hypothetical protein
MNTETPLRNRRLPFGTFRGTWLDRVPTLHLPPDRLAPLHRRGRSGESFLVGVFGFGPASKDGFPC